MDTLIGIKTKVLIVDDESSNIFVIKHILEMEADCECEEAENGEIALALLEKFNPDIVLLDIMMPGIDGYEVCRRIRKDDRYKFIKVIMISGKSHLDERLMGYEVGADDYIVKPFNENELVAKINVFKRLKNVEEIEDIRTSFLNIISHETRTPLHGIFLATQLFQSDQSLTSSQKEIVDIIYDSANRLLEFLKKLTFFCELKKGIFLEKNSLSPEIHIKKITQLYSQKTTKNVTFDIQCQEGLILHVDWVLINKVIEYIIDNAVKYSPEGGTISVSCNKKNDFCVIKITDNGPGIEKEWLLKVFDVFSIREVMHHQKGSGLSLAISRIILAAHGGKISVSSVPNQQTTFKIDLPLKKQNKS